MQNLLAERTMWSSWGERGAPIRLALRKTDFADRSFAKSKQFLFENQSVLVVIIILWWECWVYGSKSLNPKCNKFAGSWLLSRCNMLSKGTWTGKCSGIFLLYQLFCSEECFGCSSINSFAQLTPFEGDLYSDAFQHRSCDWQHRGWFNRLKW